MGGDAAQGMELTFAYPSEVTRPYMPNPQANFELIKADLEAVGFTIVIVITTYLSLIIGELVPKQFALRAPEPIAGRRCQWWQCRRTRLRRALRSGRHHRQRGSSMRGSTLP